ncbi:hypothetical protein [Mesotoga prima]|uniref:hypothetical protein n=1 Tax=Mesotoga prima TaxID=1184387 RepID=UPI002FDA253A
MALTEHHRQLLIMIDLGLGTLVLLVQLIDLILNEADLLEATVLLPGADEAPGTVIGARTGVGVAAAQYLRGWETLFLYDLNRADVVPTHEPLREYIYNILIINIFF